MFKHKISPTLIKSPDTKRDLDLGSNAMLEAIPSPSSKRRPLVGNDCIPVSAVHTARDDEMETLSNALKMPPMYKVFLSVSHANAFTLQLNT